MVNNLKNSKENFWSLLKLKQVFDDSNVYGKLLKAFKCVGKT